jgi:hypothetical protein
MKKLRLEIDTLRVDSFPAGAPELARGTVHGRDRTAIADTCGCQDTSIKFACFCTEYQTCFDCQVA